MAVSDEINFDKNRTIVQNENNVSARGKASSSASGVITSIIDQASKLHPNDPAPCVVVENTDT